MNWFRVGSIVQTVAASLALAACAPTAQLPELATVRAETEAVMQQVIDATPGEFRVDRISVESTYPCDDGGIATSGGAGEFWTGNWDVYTSPEFDVPAFIESLPGRMSEDWEVMVDETDRSHALIRFWIDDVGVLMDVMDVQDEDEPGFNILASSRCAHEPD